jgi:probable HAF family extracellular repeat protein
MYSRNIANAATSAVLLMLAGQAVSAPYQFITLGGTTGGDTYTSAINDFGQVVGGTSEYVAGYGNVYRATKWSNGVATDLGTSTTVYYPNGYYTTPYTSRWSESINNLGQVAGAQDVVYSGNIGGRHAVVWSGNKTTELTTGTTADAYSHAYGLNNKGGVVGESYYSASGQTHATLWNGGQTTDLGALSSTGRSTAMAVNDKNQIAGYSGVASGQIHATTWIGNQMTDLGTLGGLNSFAYAINNAGLVAGISNIAYTDFNYQHAVVWNGTYAIDLTPTVELGGGSRADAINSYGQVVGAVWNADYQQHATLWNGTTAIDLNSQLAAEDAAAGWVLYTATGINDKGWISGNAYNTFTGATRGFMMSLAESDSTSVDYSYMFAAPAVPEPATHAMALMGLAVFAAGLARKTAA